MTDRRIAVVLAIVLAYGALLYGALQPTGFNPLALARIDPQRPAERFWDVAPVFESGTGYDGQFFYYLARDPLLRTGGTDHLDEPAYRYQRLLLPIAAHVLALGQPGAIGWALLGVNLLALAFGCAWFARLLTTLGAKPIWLLPYALNPGYWLGIQLDLSEPLALALVTGAILARVSRRHGTAAALLTIALLARESVLAIALATAAFELWRGNRHRALTYAAPALLVAAVWQFVVFAATGAWAFRTGAGPLSVPFAAPLALVRQYVALIVASSADVATAVSLSFYLVAALAIIVLALFGIALALGKQWSGLQAATQALLLLALPGAVWEPALMSLPRVGMFLFLFLMLAILKRRTSRQPGVSRQPIDRTTSSVRELAAVPG